MAVGGHVQLGISFHGFTEKSELVRALRRHSTMAGGGGGGGGGGGSMMEPAQTMSHPAGTPDIFSSPAPAPAPGGGGGGGGGDSIAALDPFAAFGLY
jgi:hypothetical protein